MGIIERIVIMKEELLELMNDLIQDMDAHAYNNYKENDEIPVYLTVKQIYWLRELLSDEE